MFQDQVLKLSSLFKKTSSECKIIKAWQLARQLHLLSLRKLFFIRCARHLLDSCSTPAICRGLRFSEFQYDFLGIRECVFGPSFLLNLDIYKRISLGAIKVFISCTSFDQTLFKQIMTEDEVLALVHLSLLKKLLCMYTVGFCDQAFSWSSSFGWTEELCNQQPCNQQPS